MDVSKSVTLGGGCLGVLGCNGSGCGGGLAGARGSSCTMSASGSRIMAAISMPACFVASAEPLCHEHITVISKMKYISNVFRLDVLLCQYCLEDNSEFKWTKSAEHHVCSNKHSFMQYLDMF